PRSSARTPRPRVFLSKRLETGGRGVRAPFLNEPQPFWLYCAIKTRQPLEARRMKPHHFVHLMWPALTALVLWLSALLAQPAAPDNHLMVYIGTYTGAKSKGIYLSRFDVSTGKLSAPALAVAATNPSFLAVLPNRPVLYAVGEVSDFGGRKTGVISAFSI